MCQMLEMISYPKVQMTVDYRRLLILSCIILQILDGTFTAYGATFSSIGLSVEANPLVKELMTIFGIIPGLCIAKGSCIAIIRALQKMETPTHFFLIVFGIYSWVIYLWVRVIFLDNLIR